MLFPRLETPHKQRQHPVKVPFLCPIYAGRVYP
nr:MAG TPA: hypothetical protein [Caudoviricetes sp.]